MKKNLLCTKYRTSVCRGPFKDFLQAQALFKFSYRNIIILGPTIARRLSKALYRRKKVFCGQTTIRGPSKDLLQAQDLFKVFSEREDLSSVSYRKKDFRMPSTCRRSFKGVLWTKDLWGNFHRQTTFRKFSTRRKPSKHLQQTEDLSKPLLSSIDKRPSKGLLWKNPAKDFL